MQNSTDSNFIILLLFKKNSLALQQMGFWGSLWNGITSVCKTVYNSVVAPVVRAVSTVVAPIVRAVSAVVTPIIKVATKVVQTVSNVIEKGKELVSKGIDYLANQTWIGRKIKQGYDYVMNETFIGKGIKMVGNAIQKTSDAFFKETWVGQKLTQAKQWFDSTAVGQFVNKAAPVISLAATCLGGVGGVIGSTVNTASKVINVMRNPTQLFNIPIVSNTLNKVKQTTAYKSFTSAYDKGKQIYQKNIKPTIQKIKNVVDNGVTKIVNSHAYKFVSDYVQKKTPSVVYHVTNKINESKAYLKKKANEFIQPNLKRFKSTQFGNKLHKTSNFINKYVVSPSKFVASQTLGRVGSVIIDKVKQTKPYKKLITNNIDRFNNAYTKGFIQSKNIGVINELPEMKSNGIDSEQMMASYIQKYSRCKSLQTGLEKVNRKFRPVSQQKTREAPSLNEVLADQSKVKFKSVQFTSGQQQKGYSIEGKLVLENKTEEQVKFQIDSGQLFGCSNYKSSQHVVVRKLIGQLQPKQEKQFILQGFCADSGLKWPYNDKNYLLTSFAMDKFKQDMSQEAIWDETH